MEGTGPVPFSLPWWVSAPLLVTLLAPLVVTVSTVRHRQEPNIYVSLWYALAGVVWLPLLYLVAALPAPSAIGGAVSESVALFGLSNLWVVGMGIGLAYYALVKETGNPLASRQLARVGFWSLAFASAWGGAGPLVFGPVPDWLEALAFMMTLALPVSALANAANLSLTTERVWAERSDRPVVAATLGGAFFALLTAALASFGTVRSAAAVVGLTPLLGRGSVCHTVRRGRVSGGRLVIPGAPLHHRPDPGRPGTGPAPSAPHILGGRVDGRIAGGCRSGGRLRLDGWVLQAGSARPGEAGETWWGCSSLLLGLSILSGLLTLAGQVAFCMAVLRTFTSGRAATQEVLAVVPAEDSSEREGEETSGTGEEE